MVKTFRGRTVDMTTIAKQYEKTIALGNANMNGRGDKLASGGTIYKTREELLAESKVASVTHSGLVSLKTDIEKEESKPVVDDSIKVASVSKKTPKYENITQKEIEELEKLKV